jgi:hypothetical protein
LAFFIGNLLDIQPIDKNAENLRLNVFKLQDLSFSFNEASVERGFKVWGVMTYVVFVYSKGMGLSSCVLPDIDGDDCLRTPAL